MSDTDVFEIADNDEARAAYNEMKPVMIHCFKVPSKKRKKAGYPPHSNSGERGRCLQPPCRPVKIKQVMLLPNLKAANSQGCCSKGQVGGIHCYPQCSWHVSMTTLVNPNGGGEQTSLSAMCAAVCLVVYIMFIPKEVERVWKKLCERVLQHLKNAEYMFFISLRLSFC